MRWNTKCICFTKLAETSWSKKNLKRCVPKRSSKDGWRAKDIPKRVAFRHFCHPVLRYGTQIRRLPRVTRLNETFKSSMSECRNVLVNALVKVTGTVRRSDLITSAKSFTSWVFAIPKFITAWVDGTPRFTCNSMPTSKNPEELQCAFQNWSRSWFYLCAHNLWYSTASPIEVCNKTIQLLQTSLNPWIYDILNHLLGFRAIGPEATCSPNASSLRQVQWTQHLTKT